MTAEPRHSASLCLLRNGARGIEVLMAQRTHTARFMPGAWVFPGGVVDEADWSQSARDALAGLRDEAELGWVAAAVRETLEETGVWLATAPFTIPPEERRHGVAVFEQAIADDRRFDVSGLRYFANWITPADLPVRFDARFYLVEVAHEVQGAPDTLEMASVDWIPVGAAAQPDSATMSLPFPTLKTLQRFSSFETTAELLSWAARLDHVPPTQPRVRLDGDVAELVLPWDPGYEDLPDRLDTGEPLVRVTAVRGVDGSPVMEIQPPAGSS